MPLHYDQVSPRIFDDNEPIEANATQNAFDDYGNLTTIGSRSFAVDTRTNRITSATYNRAGNQLSSGSGATLQHYQFDALNRLSTHQNTGAARGFVYTATGKRLVEIDFTADPWEEVWTIRDLEGRVVRQWQRSGDSWLWSKDYIYRGPRLLASEEPDGTRHFHLDHLGTPRLITDGSQTKGEHVYFPFGEEVTSANQNAERMKFTGHERDVGDAGREDDLDYMYARYCSPETGRFLSVDPKRIGKPVAGQSWNRYAYTEGNPLKFVDPDGEASRGVMDFERDALAMLEGRMTSQQFQERNAARAAGALAGVSLFLPGPEDLALAAATSSRIGQLVSNRISGVFSRLLGRLGRGGSAPRGLAEGARYAQRTYSTRFSGGGLFRGKTVDNVATSLRSGELSPSQVPVNYIVRDGNTLILNTRSAQALEAAGIPRSQWRAINQTGNEIYENLLDGQLQRNGLTSEGIVTVRPSGGG